MTKNTHRQTWFRRGRASHRESATGGRSRVRQLHLETLEDRSLLSGNAVADVTDGGTVELGTDLYVQTYDGAANLAVYRGASLLASRWEFSGSDLTYSIVVNWQNDRSPKSASFWVPASVGNFLQTITLNDLSANPQLAEPAGVDVDADKFQAVTGLSFLSSAIGAVSEIVDFIYADRSGTISGSLKYGPYRAADGGRVDVASVVDKSDPVTEGGWVDITPLSGEPDWLAGPFPEHTPQVGSGLAQGPNTPAAHHSPKKDIVVEGAGGISQAFEVAMFSSPQIDGNHAQPQADRHGPYGSRSATSVPPTTTWVPGDRGAPASNGGSPANSPNTEDERHEAIASRLPYDAAATVSFVADTGSRTGGDQSRVAASRLSGQGSSAAELIVSDLSAETLAIRAARLSDSGFDGQQVVFAKEEDWSQGDFDWLAVNMHKARPTHAMALVAAALVTLRSPGWYLPLRDERQTFLTPPPERTKSGGI